MKDDLAVALAVTLLVQSTVSLAVFTPAILTPTAHRDIGVAASSIGIFTALMYTLATLSAPMGGSFISRLGAVRVSQSCLLLAGTGLALCVLGHPVAVAVGAMFIGSGYGPLTPASSEILVTRTPERMRNLIMSIRQTGVPVGGAIAGAVVPVLLLAHGWKATALAIAALNLLCAFALEPARRRFDRADVHARYKSRPSLIALVRMVFAHAELRQVSLASFTYAGIQMCLASFLVVFLTERAGLSVTNAGFALSASMLGGIIGRIVWGIAADALGSARTVLGLIGIVMALSAFALSQVSVGWPFAAIVVLCIVFGTTALGWNGVYVAEVARIAPGGDVALATGASLAFTYLGVVVAPFAFWAIVAASSSYSIAYIVIGAVTLIGAMTYFRRVAT